MNNGYQMKIIKPGIFTTIQGMPDYNRLNKGQKVGGCLDVSAAIEANRLVGNPPSAPVMEITMIGPEISVQRSVEIGIRGARFQIFIDDHLVSQNDLIKLEKGKILKFGKLLKGCRAYAAFKGLFMQYTHDTPFRKDDNLLLYPIDNSSSEAIAFESLPVLKKSGHTIIPLFKGPESDWFTSKSLEALSSYIWTIHPQSNRIGYILKGPSLIKSNDSELISSGVIPGTVQVSHDGLPILLMYDAQVTGGYPRIAVIPKPYLSHIAQLKSDDKIAFEWLD